MVVKVRAGNRRDRALGALVTPRLADNPLSRACPKCEAKPGHRCRRWIGGRVCGQETGGGYWRPLKRVHDERKQQRTTKTEVTS